MLHLPEEAAKTENQCPELQCNYDPPTIKLANRENSKRF
jgi:hypothetical protein